MPNKGPTPMPMVPCQPPWEGTYLPCPAVIGTTFPPLAGTLTGPQNAWLSLEDTVLPQVHGLPATDTTSPRLWWHPACPQLGGGGRILQRQELQGQETEARKGRALTQCRLLPARPVTGSSFGHPTCWMSLSGCVNSSGVTTPLGTGHVAGSVATGAAGPRGGQGGPL